MEKETSIKLYRKLRLMRSTEEYIVAHYHEDEMKTPMHMSMGQEAVPAAVALALGDRAQFISSYRSHAPYLARTENVEQFLGEMYGRINGTGEGKGGSMHLSNPENGFLFATGIVGAGIAPALGVAYVNKIRKNGCVAATFFGDGAVDEGMFWESVNAASVMKLPVFFVCEDNDFAVHTTTVQRHGFNSISDVGKIFYCKIMLDDTNDPQKIFALVEEAIAHIEDDGGPVLFHMKTKRHLEHVGTGKDFHLGYRSKDDFDEWHSKKDCLVQQAQHLRNVGVSDEEISDIDKEIRKIVEDAGSIAKITPQASADRLYHGVFHEEA